MCWSASQVYVGDDHAPGIGRSFCIAQLRAALADGPGRDDLIYDTALVASELLTNSVRAGSRVTRFSLAVHRDHLRVVVDDDAPGQPRARTPESDETTGRGIAIVTSIASHWSVEPLIPGKRVWAELDVPPDLTADLPSCHRPTRFELNVTVRPEVLPPRLGSEAGTAEPRTLTPPAEV